MNISLWIDPPLSGLENMARDRVLFERIESGLDEIYLRLYTWTEPTYSYGYRQTAASLPNKNIPAVQRLTGGGIVLHQPEELTYCFVAPKKLFPENIMASCLKLSEPLIKALQELGIPAEIAGRSGEVNCVNEDCFARPATYEILANGKKILGSAQKRGTTALLQHGAFKLPERAGFRTDRLQKAIIGAFLTYF
jgi:lipoyl(octanoyl) transferase